MASTVVNFGTGVGTKKKATYELIPQDANGNPTTIELNSAVLETTQPGTTFGNILFQDASRVVVELERTVLAPGEAVSTTIILLKADGDATSGVKEISAEFVCNHVAADATGFGVSEVSSEVETAPAV